MIDDSGNDLHSFGLSDTSGTARLAVTQGPWMFHPSENILRDQGFIEIKAFELSITDEDQHHRIIAERAQGTAPNLIASQSPDLLAPRFRGSGESGQRFIIEASTQLKEWREFGRVIAESGSFTISDTLENSSKQLFIRARPE